MKAEKKRMENEAERPFPLHLAAPKFSAAHNVFSCQKPVWRSHYSHACIIIKRNAAHQPVGQCQISTFHRLSFSPLKRSAEFLDRQTRHDRVKLHFWNLMQFPKTVGWLGRTQVVKAAPLSPARLFIEWLGLNSWGEFVIDASISSRSLTNRTSYSIPAQIHGIRYIDWQWIGRNEYTISRHAIRLPTSFNVIH